MTIGDWLPQAEQRLTEAGVVSARLEARLLAATALDSDWTTVFAHPEWKLDNVKAEALLSRRTKREPLAYIVGWREFYGRRFHVNPHVLIPRQETEVLVEQALEYINLSGEPFILDLGSGSGCVAITIKLERANASVLGSDISTAALNVARANAKHLDADVPFIESDAFTKMAWRKFDLIVTNPPYIGIHEELMPEVAKHEPSSALFAGETGLDFYERLANEATPFLQPNGKLLMEVGHTQATAVRKLFVAHQWKHVATTQDLSSVDRVLVVEKS